MRSLWIGLGSFVGGAVVGAVAKSLMALPAPTAAQLTPGVAPNGTTVVGQGQTVAPAQGVHYLPYAPR